jgi:predicted metal-dependent phosphoesterase TrpH
MKVMKMDFHTHVKLSKKTRFDLAFFQEIMMNAKDSGLDALAMTEHFNTDNFYEIYDILDQHYPYENGHYTVDGLYIFPGMEVDVESGGHILVVSGRDAIRTMRQQLDMYTEKPNFIPLEQLIQLAKAHDALLIGAHPLRPSTPLFHHDPDLLKQLDAFDLNGKDLYEHGVENMRTRVEEFVQMIDKPIVYGSDSHHPVHIGISRNEFPAIYETAKEVKMAIKAGTYTSSLSPVLHTKVHAAKIVKKQMKEALLSQ